MRKIVYILILCTSLAHSQTKATDTYVESQFKHWLKNCTLGIEKKDVGIYIIHFYWNNPVIPCDGCNRICWLREISEMEILFRIGKSYTLRQISYDDCDNEIWAAYFIKPDSDGNNEEFALKNMKLMVELEKTPWAFIKIEAQDFTYNLKPDSWPDVNPTPERFFMDAIRVLKGE